MDSLTACSEDNTGSTQELSEERTTEVTEKVKEILDNPGILINSFNGKTVEVKWGYIDDGEFRWTDSTTYNDSVACYDNGKRYLGVFYIDDREQEEQIMKFFEHSDDDTWQVKTVTEQGLDSDKGAQEALNSAFFHAVSPCREARIHTSHT